MMNYGIDEAWAFENCHPSEDCCACKSYQECRKYHLNPNLVYQKRNKVRVIDVRNAEAFVEKACDIFESCASVTKRFEAMCDLVSMWYDYHGRTSYDKPKDI